MVATQQPYTCAQRDGGEFRACDGSSLVEVMFAMVILAVMTIGTSAYLYQTGAGVAFQGNRRAALEAANSRLEHTRVSNYSDLAPSDANVYYLYRSGSTWARASANPNETVAVNGDNCPMDTTVRKVTASNPTREYLVIHVSVGYRLSSSARINLETIVSP